MVNQKAISLKIDYGILEDLDREASLGWRKRNSHINEAIRFYLEYRDTVRRIRSYGDPKDKMEEFTRFKEKWFPMLVGL